MPDAMVEQCCGMMAENRHALSFALLLAWRESISTSLL
jgi:hypothetical protein